MVYEGVKKRSRYEDLCNPHYPLTISKKQRIKNQSLKMQPLQGWRLMMFRSTFLLCIILFSKGFGACVSMDGGYSQPAKRKLIFTIDDMEGVRVKPSPLKKLALRKASDIPPLEKPKSKPKGRSCKPVAQPEPLFMPKEKNPSFTLDYFKAHGLVRAYGDILRAYPGGDLNYYEKTNSDLKIFIKNIKETLLSKKILSSKTNELWQIELNTWIRKSEGANNKMVAHFMRLLSALMAHKITQNCEIYIGEQPKEEQEELRFTFNPDFITGKSAD